MVILSSNFRYLQVYVLRVRTAVLLPVQTDWFHSVLSFRKVYKVTDIPWCLVSLEVSGWFLDSKFVPLDAPISWHEVTQ